MRSCSKDRTKAIIPLYISPEANPLRQVSPGGAIPGENIPFAISQDSCVEEDWINNWKKYFSPSLWKLIESAHLAGEDRVRRPGPCSLHLEPSLAFRCSTHETLVSV